MSYPWAQPGAQVTVGAYATQAPTVAAQIRGMAHEVTDEIIERDRPGFRGIMLAQLQEVLGRCDQGDPEDPRWDELRLRALDRMAKLLRLYEPDAAGIKAGPPDSRLLAGQAAAALTELEASLAETRGA